MLGLLAYRQYATAPANWLRQAAEASEHGDCRTALKFAEKATRRWPHSAPAWLAAAQAASQLGDVPTAMHHYSQAAVTISPDEAVPILAAEARSLLNHRRLAIAEVCLDNVLTLQPDNTDALAALAGCRLATGRRVEAVPLILRLAQLDAAPVPMLAALSSPGIWIVSREDVELNVSAEPRYAPSALGLAEILLREGNPVQAAEHVRRALDQNSDLAAARVLLARCLIAEGKWDDFAVLRRELLDLEDDPTLWLAQADWAEANGQAAAAARCLWESVRREPLYLTANHRLAQSLQALQRSSEAAKFARYAEQLRGLVFAANRGLDAPDDVSLLSAAATALEQCGALWEARAWWGHVLRAAPLDDAATERRRQLDALLSENLQRFLADRVPALTIDLSDLPLPDYTTRPVDAPQAESVLAYAIRFEDQAREVGLQFEYFAAPDDSTPGVRMFEFTGGGVGVLDYNLDGWPDMHFTQGCRWPPEPGQTEFCDRFWRNDFGRCLDVTAAAGLEEAGFSQGVACGDHNSDGFPDLLVANLGVNVLFRNQSDGCFQSVPLPAQHPRTWTSSCLLVDLNGDSAADIYEAHYLAPQADLETLCQDGACSPLIFRFGADRVLCSQNDGTFVDVSKECGLSPDDGPGLGLLALPSSQPGKVDVFVANDQTANAFFVQESAPRGMLLWRDLATPAGLAFDSQGSPQACMGVTAEDADGDGRIDVFVTNFYLESNTLYLQQAPGLFEDSTRACGLREPSWEMLGFGTQFIDADLDGWPDLVVANGNIEDRRHAGEPYAMQPQFFRNCGAARFEELPAAQVGDYFCRELRGRGLARLDFNRDGREDFAVSHLDSPASLVINDSPRQNHALLLRLCGIRSHRDAYGAQLVVRVGPRTLHRWLIPGGYFCSHEPQFVVGLGAAEQADEVRLIWPSGDQQTWHDLAADRHWLARECNAEILALPLDSLAAD